MLQGLSETADPVDSALGQYLGQTDFKIRVISKDTVRENHNHRSGNKRSVYKFSLEKNGTEYLVYAKKSEDVLTVSKEFRVTDLLSSNSENSTTIVPSPLLLSNGILITEGFRGTPLLELLKELTVGMRGQLNQQTEILNLLFKNIGGWLATFHNNSNLAKVFPENPEDRQLGSYARECFNEYMKIYGGQYIGNNFRKKIEHFLKDIITSRNLVSDRGPVHGDFCYQNILLSLKEKRSCIVDFEDACMGYQLFDVVRCCSKLRLLSARLFNTTISQIIFDLEKKFLEGYSAKKSFDNLSFEILMLIDLLRIRTPLQIDPGAGWKKKAYGILKRLGYRQLLREQLKKLQKA